MKFLVIGLGSMGKRRVRCLKALNYSEIIGIDPREDRRKETEDKYLIKTFDSIDKVSLEEIDAFVVSTPPDLHTEYLELAICNKIPSFVEASVLTEEVESINNKNIDNVFIAPSCTLRFHPLVKEIKKVVESRALGKITNFTYHSGQYLPDWHPWEDVNEFYVSNRDTGGGREIVPFELTWLIDVLGFPNNIKGFFSKTIDFGADIEDTYAFVLKYDNYIGSMIVDVASRFATRSLILNFEKGQLRWNWEDAEIKIYDASNDRWSIIDQPQGNNEDGYNKNIVEEMYIEEVDAFIKGIDDSSMFSNSITDDIKVLKLLNQIEISDGGF